MSDSNRQSQHPASHPYIHQLGVHAWVCAEGASAETSLPLMPRRPNASECPCETRARPLLRLKRDESCSRTDERRPVADAAAVSLRCKTPGRLNDLTSASARYLL